ncbi:exo 1,3/1,4-beta-D-glucan glucohydrolase [Pseudoxanthomonas sp. F37]|uniref:glycoside hydrolase family 3 protein n=1 Tax=Pseudoxanthomonas sp. F37 TaxID=2932492 RepID=UPI001FD22E8F|nr:glycoside hydrolase family 3 protein [Pseudoxanthomonas sp. F37]UOV09754.1 exo 1,3/1,4-beta-D-glucan glucohydrolase [Pseudoxanthomonas sp. F37]
MKSIRMTLLGAGVLACLSCTGQKDAETPPAAAAADASAALKDWPALTSRLAKDPAIEARVAEILASMTLEQKIGQMVQPEIKSITPEEVRQYYIGSVLNGGGSWPAKNKHARVQDWVALADAYYDASMGTDAKIPVPVIWGTDAVHGHSNVYGATIFPHNIGLGAAHDVELIERIAEATGQSTRATGVTWTFAPTVAVAQNARWGRTYESYSSQPALIREYAAAYVKGMQGLLDKDGNVVATAKHFIGDGATDGGKDQGNALVTQAQMINVHGQGYYGAIEAGVQTVMASFNSWNDIAAGTDYGKMHGSRDLLTVALKEKMGFDGFVVSDWNGIGQVPGCTDDSCAQAINAGIDMVMVPDAWKPFIANTIAQVKSGQIPQARIDDAVTRILRVKLRARLWDHKPSASQFAGKPESLVHRDLARRAVRESLVLLKNDGGALPLKKGQRVLLVGKSADSISNQTGGWSLTWQGTDNTNADFPNADSIAAGLREQLGEANVILRDSAEGVDPASYDVIVAAIGETPYAETNGDIVPSDTMAHSRRHPEDLAVLKAAAATGKPVVTVFLSGRALYANDLINLSSSFVAAWLPGTEGKGITDVLVAGEGGKPAHDFRGRLTFPWPAGACPNADSMPQFPLDSGLRYGDTKTLGRLPEDATASCGEATALGIFKQSDIAPFTLQMEAGGATQAVGNDLNATQRWPQAKPALQVATVQVNTQQDAKEVTWLAPARFFARNPSKNNLAAMATARGVLQFDVVVKQAPAKPVQFTLGCGAGCGASLDLTATFSGDAVGRKQTVKVPLACFGKLGADLTGVDTPFSITADAPFAAAFTNIQVVAGAADGADVVKCAQ